MRTAPLATTAVALLLLIAPLLDAAAPPKAPAGFTIERVDPEGKISFPMFACFDDAGRLFVTESSGLDLYAEISALTRKCRISVLEDKDGDGRYETSTVFQDRLVMPMGAAWRDGKLYVPDGADLVSLEDTDGDGRADKRTVLLSGFGHYDNGGLHGMTFGPDGWLYMTCGQPDGYKLRRTDGSVLESKSGALLRCRPDGSDVQCLSRGFENLVEVVFFGTGDVVGTVNWFQKPEGGIRDALVHLAHGGLYPYVPDVGTPQLVSGPFLPAVTKFPAVALSGLVMPEGEGLGPQWRGSLVSAQHNSRKVGRHAFTRDGATFRSEDFDFVTSDDPDFHPSDVLEDADGSILVVDTGSWYIHHCPTGQIRNSPATGGIWRVRREGAPKRPDPRGAKIDWKQSTPTELTRLLSNPRPAVRRKAREELALRGSSAVPPVARALQATTDVEVAQRLLWTLASVPDEPAGTLLRSALDEQSDDLVAAAARALGSRRDRAAAPALCRVINSAAAPHARAAAAEALAYCGDARSVHSIWSALAATVPADRFVEHNLILAAHQSADDASLTAALHYSNARVQAAALLLLDQPPRPAGALPAAAAFDRLAAGDEYLRQVALQRVERHPEWAPQAIELIRKANSPEQDERLCRLVLAFEADPQVQALAAGRMSDASLTPERRVRLIEALAHSRLPQVPTPVAEVLRQLIDDPAAPVRDQAVRTAAALNAPALDDKLGSVATDSARPAGVRLEALRAVIPRRPRLDPAAFDLLLSQLGPKAAPSERLTASSQLGRATVDEAQAKKVLAAVRGDTLISPSTVLPALAKAARDSESVAWELIGYLSESLGRGWEPSAEQIEELVADMPAAARPQAEILRTQLRETLDRRRARLAEYEPLLTGGDPARGRAVFFANKVACSTCHRVGSEGGTVGPDLTKVGAIRAGRDLLESIVLPSSTIAQGFDHYVVQTKTGEVHAGVIPQPSADVLEVRDSAGNAVRVHKDQVARLKRQPVSLMPDGLAGALSRDEFRDLLAFLQSLR